MSKEKVVIIIPTYNEEAVIKNTISQVFKEVESLENHEIHILIFDSASKDNTCQIVKKLQTNLPNLHLQTEMAKSGLGSAYSQAMHYTLKELQADIIVEFDADLSHQPKYLVPMLAELKSADVVVGSRYVKGGCIPENWGWNRKIFSILGNLISRVFLTLKYKDFTSGFRATRRKYLEKVLPRKFISANYAYKLQLFWLLHKAGAKIKEYPIEFIDRTLGESKLPKSSIKDSLKVLFILRFNELRRYLKMCMVGLLGTFIQFMVYNILRIHITPVHASQLASTAALINNYILNNKFTFKQQSIRSLSRFVSFICYSTMMVWLQSSWLHLAIAYFGEGFWKENIAVACGICVSSVVNYFTYSRHIWAEPKDLTTSPP